MNDKFIKDTVVDVLGIETSLVAQQFIRNWDMASQAMNYMLRSGYVFEITMSYDNKDYIVSATQWTRDEESEVTNYIFATGDILQRVLMEVLVKSGGESSR